MNFPEENQNKDDSSNRFDCHDHEGKQLDLSGAYVYMKGVYDTLCASVSIVRVRCSPNMNMGLWVTSYPCNQGMRQ